MRHVEHLLRYGFDAGLDIFLRCKTSRCPRGAPPSVRTDEAYQDILPIRLDASHHVYNKPRFTRRGVYLTLSFWDGDKCVVGVHYFPWWSILTISFGDINREKVTP